MFKLTRYIVLCRDELDNKQGEEIIENIIKLKKTL